MSVTRQIYNKVNKMELDQLAQIHISRPSGKLFLELFWDPKRRVVIAVPEDEHLGEHEVCIKADIASIVKEVMGCKVYTCTSAWTAMGAVPAIPEAATMSKVRKDYHAIALNLACL